MGQYIKSTERKKKNENKKPLRIFIQPGCFSESKMKIFPDFKKKLKDFITCRPALQKMVKSF